MTVPLERHTDSRPLPLNVAELRRQLDDDDELIADVIGLFLDDYPARMAAIASAVQACDIARLRREAHALKGGAANLSAPLVVEAARRLEATADGESPEILGTRFASLVAEVDSLAAALRRIQPTRS